MVDILITALMISVAAINGVVMHQHFGIIPSDPISSAGIYSVSGDIYLFRFSLAISNSQALGLSTSGSAICVSVCLM